MTPRLVLVGGWEFVKDDGIDAAMAEFCGGKILFVPDASKFPDKQIERARAAYSESQTDVVLLGENETKVPNGIKVVYFGGGHPEKLMEYFKRRPELLEDIKAKWHAGELIWCGSSTGAMVVCQQMLAHGSRGRGGTELAPALGLIKNNAVVIPHWDEPDGPAEWRERIVQDHKDKTLITIDEHTAIWWSDNGAKVLGLGNVNVFTPGEQATYRPGEIIKNFAIISQ